MRQHPPLAPRLCPLPSLSEERRLRAYVLRARSRGSRQCAHPFHYATGMGACLGRVTLPLV